MHGMMTKKKFGALDAVHGILTIPMLYYFFQFLLQLTPMISIQNNFERDNSYAKIFVLYIKPKRKQYAQFQKTTFLM